MGDHDEARRSVGLPSNARLYEREYQYWPWGGVIGFVAAWIQKHAPHGANVLDYMCGTGFLLHKARESRPDLNCFGCSLTAEYIAFANEAYPDIAVVRCDARQYVPPAAPDVVLCTAGLHHLSFEDQPAFLRKVASEITAGKWFVLAEEITRAWNSEAERRLAVIELLSAAMGFMANRDAPPEVIGAAADVLKADLTKQEYKVDRDRLVNMITPYFAIEAMERVWPAEDRGYGDYVFVCRRK